MPVKNISDFFSTNLVDQVAHCIARARKLDASQFGCGGNPSADNLIESTVRSVYTAVFDVMNAPAMWVGTHQATLDCREVAALDAGRRALTHALLTSSFPERENFWLFERLFGFPDLGKKISPTSGQIIAMREAAKLTQSEAAALIGKPMRTWQNWEAPEGSSAHRQMDPALFELFQIKLKTAGCTQLPTSKQ